MACFCCEILLLDFLDLVGDGRLLQHFLVRLDADGVAADVTLVVEAVDREPLDLHHLLLLLAGGDVRDVHSHDLVDVVDGEDLEDASGLLVVVTFDEHCVDYDICFVVV